MASFEVTGYFNEPSDAFTSRPESTNGVVVFEPPFVLGEGFRKVALGLDGHGMLVEHIGSTEQATVLRVNASGCRGNDSERRLAIDEVGNRVVQFIENPGSTAELMQQNPFPLPEERW
jgi:hypothetical protein